MMFSKNKVAIFSDLHLGVHNNSNQWHDISIEWCKWYITELKKHDIKDVIFCGDWYHNRSEISVDTLTVSAQIFDMFREFNLVVITGNHDLYFKHRTDVHSLNIMKGRPNITIIDQPTTVTAFDKTISFLPWGFDLKDVQPGDVCFGHLEIESFQMNSAKACEHGMKASNLLKMFNLVISGHFHTRHERQFGAGTILYVGNPFQMDFGDCGNTKGYYILDFDDMSYTFNENVMSPTYKKISLSELISFGTINETVKNIFNNNFVRLKIDKNISSDDLNILTSKLGCLKVSGLTIDYDLNYNKLMTSSNEYDFSSIDIPKAIEEFINLLDIEDRSPIIQYTLNLYKRCSAS